MLTAVNPKLPMRNKDTTRNFYITKLGFKEFGSDDFDGYLMLEKDEIQIHFFDFKELDPLKNYGQIYIRTIEIEKWYQSKYQLYLNKRVLVVFLVFSGHIFVPFRSLFDCPVNICGKKTLRVHLGENFFFL